MNQRDLSRFDDIRKIKEKKKADDDFSFFENLDLMDFRDDLSYK